MPDYQDDLTKQILQRQQVNGAMAGQPSVPPPPAAAPTAMGGFSFSQPTIDLQSLVEALKKAGMTGSRTSDVDLDVQPQLTFDELMKRAQAIPTSPK